jgi:hypothetical protein
MGLYIFLAFGKLGVKETSFTYVKTRNVRVCEGEVFNSGSYVGSRVQLGGKDVWHEGRGSSMPP